MDIDPIGVPHADFAVEYVAVDRAVKLRVMSWHPRTGDTGIPLIFVAGWVSVVEGWGDLLQALAARHTVYYIETREKNSAVIDNGPLHARQFSIRQMAEDIIAACDALNLDMSSVVVSGSSLGASVLIETMKHGRLKPKGAFLIGPSPEFHYPWWGFAVVNMPAVSYHILKHPILWYMRHFRVDSKKEPEQMRRYEQTLKQANPKRIKLSAVSFRTYTVWSDFETIESPMGIAFAGSDKLHNREIIDRMVRVAPKATSVPCPSNKYMHSAQLAPDIEAFIGNL